MKVAKFILEEKCNNYLYEYYDIQYTRSFGFVFSNRLKILLI